MAARAVDREQPIGQHPRALFSFKEPQGSTAPGATAWLGSFSDKPTSRDWHQQKHGWAPVCVQAVAY